MSCNGGELLAVPLKVDLYLFKSTDNGKKVTDVIVQKTREIGMSQLIEIQMI